MTEFELPVNLVRDVEHSATTRPVRRAWLAALPEVVGELSLRWSLDVGRPFQPGV